VQNSERTKVFISYSRRDAEWLARLHTHLKPLERQYGAIEFWDDTKIRPGSSWRDEIEKALKAAKVAVLLISADFLASDFIASDELPPLLHAAATEGTVILPVIIKPSRFSRVPSLNHFQTVNDPAKPLASMSEWEQEAVLDKVTQAIERVLNESRVVPDSPDNEPKSERRRKRRIDAAVQSSASLNEHVDLLVQVRLPSSAPLGIKDWPSKRPPASIEQTSANATLEFPRDGRTGKIGSARLIIRVVAPDFVIRGGEQKLIEIPPDGPSEVVKFLLTANSSGICKINVEVYKIDETYLGTVPLETVVGEGRSPEASSVTNMMLIVVVGQERQHPAEAKIPDNDEGTDGVLPPDTNGSVSASHKRSIALAIISGLVSLTIAYWQFVYKPSQAELVPYTGRVTDASTNRAISNAKVIIESQGPPQIYYSDSEGIFNVKLPKTADNVRVKVEAEGYRIADRNISLSRTGMEDVRLSPVIASPGGESSPTPPPAPTPSASPTPTERPRPRRTPRPTRTRDPALDILREGRP